jgi:hypothetical protein
MSDSEIESFITEREEQNAKNEKHRKERKRFLNGFFTYPRSKHFLMDEVLKTFNPYGVEYLILGMENHAEKEGDETQEHNHIFVRFRKAISWNMESEPEKFNINGHHPHFQVARSAKNVMRYCQKDGKYETFGTVPHTMSGILKKAKYDVTQLYLMDPEKLIEENIIKPIEYIRWKAAAAAYLLDKAPKKDHTHVRGIWCVGPAGTGKSRSVRHFFGEDLFVKPQNKWWDGYQGEKYVLIDDYDTKNTGLLHYLKIWGDRYFCTGEIKGGTIPLHHQILVITSNYHPFHFCKNDTGEEDEELVEAMDRRFRIYQYRKEAPWAPTGNPTPLIPYLDK